MLHNMTQFVIFFISHVFHYTYSSDLCKLFFYSFFPDYLINSTKSMHKDPKNTCLFTNSLNIFLLIIF